MNKLAGHAKETKLAVRRGLCKQHWNLETKDVLHLRIVGLGSPLRTVYCTTYPYLQFDPLVLSEDRLHLEVYPDGGDEGRGEGVVCVPEEEAGLSDGRVSDDEQLEHVVEVLVGRVLLP